MNDLTPMVYHKDGGPIYFESQFQNFVAEPWNMASAVIFIILAAYWLWRTKNQVRRQTFVFGASVLLMIGAIGGTIYHGFRVSQIALLMDWLPIFIICLGAAIYFLKLSLGSWWSAAMVILVFVLLEVLNYLFINPIYATSISYIAIALVVLIPTFLILSKTKYRNYHLIVMAVLAFGLAISFRISDRYGLLPMGTHFLWHTFGALATGSMFLYVYRLELFFDKKMSGLTFGRNVAVS